MDIHIQGGQKISEKERSRIEKCWESPEGKKMLKELINIFGEYKKVQDETTGKWYKVPSKTIITRGLSQEELVNFPEWSD